MENVFYAAPSQFSEGNTAVVLEGQEAHHISKVLRKKEGDEITVANGQGSHFKGTIRGISRQQVFADCTSHEFREPSKVKKTLALGIIKKRDRLEFAIEKAVELGATEICLFQAERSERTKLKQERLELLVISAFKQSGRFWLPKINVLPAIEDVLFSYPDHEMIMAHEEKEVQPPIFPLSRHLLLMVGPEGGFSRKETMLVQNAGGRLISLGKNRLRAETAVTAILSQVLFIE